MKKLVLFLVIMANHTQATGPNLETLDGEYEMKIEIDQRVHYDRLHLYGVNSSITVSNFDGAIKGKIVVPRIFEAELSGQAVCGKQDKNCSISFEIQAKENGQSYKVIYKGISINNNRIRGSAYLENNTKLGDFEAIKN